MKKNAILAMAAFALLIATSAKAADIPGASRPYSAPNPYSAYSWMGPYAGVNLGYQSGSMTNNPTEPSGAAVGVQVGYNWQSGQFVFGGETDLQQSNAVDVLAP